MHRATPCNSDCPWPGAHGTAATAFVPSSKLHLYTPWGGRWRLSRSPRGSRRRPPPPPSTGRRYHRRETRMPCRSHSSCTAQRQVPPGQRPCAWDAPAASKRLGGASKRVSPSGRLRPPNRCGHSAGTHPQPPGHVVVDGQRVHAGQVLLCRGAGHGVGRGACRHPARRSCHCSRCHPAQAASPPRCCLPEADPILGHSCPGAGGMARQGAGRGSGASGRGQLPADCPAPAHLCGSTDWPSLWWGPSC
jgi:hypothetical protein